MKTRTPEEYQRWLVEQTRDCLSQSNQVMDTKLTDAVENAAQEYAQTLERLIASRKKTDDLEE